MAALLNSAPANSPDQSNPGFVRAVAGFAALVIGVAAIFGSAVHSDVEFHPAVAPAGVAITTSGAFGVAGEDVSRAAQLPDRLIPGDAAPRPDRRSTGPTIPNRIGADFERALAEKTGAESAHVETFLFPLQPDGWDVRWGLMEMAAAQRRNWTLRCPCPIIPASEPRGGPR